MNWHFTFFLLDIAGWLGVALLFNMISTTRPYKINLSTKTKATTIIITLSAGFLSTLIHGLPDLGLSVNSFISAGLASSAFIIYQKLRTKKVVTKHKQINRLTINNSFSKTVREVI